MNRPRGLCWTCYYAVGIREHYVTDSKYLRRGVGNGNPTFRMPAEPTDAKPGSPEKLAILETRAAAGVALWHPDDLDVLQLKSLARTGQRRRRRAQSLRRLAALLCDPMAA